MRHLPPLRLLLPAAIAFATSASAPAISAVPSPVTSSLDRCFVVCPAGDITFHVVVRDPASNAVANSTVVLDFSGCPTFVHCSGLPSGIVDDVHRTITGTTDVNGVVNFSIPMGGICPMAVEPAAFGVEVVADGVLLGSRNMASPDRDGNLFPDALDLAAIQALVGTNDPTADFDCDGMVTAADVAIFEQHLHHACPLVVPARSRSWGEIKLIYR